MRDVGTAPAGAARPGRCVSSDDSESHITLRRVSIIAQRLTKHDKPDVRVVLARLSA